MAARCVDCGQAPAYAESSQCIDCFDARYLPGGLSFDPTRGDTMPEQTTYQCLLHGRVEPSDRSDPRCPECGRKLTRRRR